jgi:hypothetical protein
MLKITLQMRIFQHLKEKNDYGKQGFKQNKHRRSRTLH